MNRFPSTSRSSGPLPLAMKSGSRPTAFIARTGLLTPPGMTRRARSKSSRDRASFKPSRERASRMSCFPLGVVGREVEQSNLLELRGGVEDRAVVLTGPGDGGNAVENRVAFLF